MKKILFLLLLLPLLGGGLLSAQTVSNLAVSPGAAGSPSTVTFDVSWNKATLTTPWLDSMWVFVDYNKNGRMERLLISGGTLTEHTATKAGTGIFIPENDMGAWVYGDARTNTAGSFSAKVQLFTKEADIVIAGACAYASSYPPVSNWIDDTKIVFNGTPWYEVTLSPEGGGADETVKSGSTFLLPCSYTMSSFTDKTGAPGIINCKAPTALTLATPFTTVCAGETVTLTASATGAASYSIDGTNWQPEAAFEVAPTSTTHYTLYAKTEEECVGSVADAAVVTIYPVLSPGEIDDATTSITAGMNPPSETTVNLADATGGSGNITYEWRRSGASTATLTGSAATYAIGADAANYGIAGTYYFNRYAQDATCNTEWVAAMGTYTLNVGASTITFCEECCWAGDAVDISAGTWVNCHVTTNTYPFDNPSLNTPLYWIGYGNGTFYSGASGPGSDKNGRANTAAISVSAGTTTAVGVCKALGTGWYLPAYEEYINMGPSNPVYLASYPPLNGRAGANIMLGGCYYASTESYGNGGRYSAANPSTGGSNDYKLTGVRYFSYLSNPIGAGHTQYSCHVHCAWRPLP